MKYYLLGALSTLALVFALSQPAKADVIDPAIFIEDDLSNTCPANCGSFTLAVDPFTSQTTEEIIFNSTVPTVVAGDLKIDKFGTSIVEDVLSFENVGGKAIAFIYSNDGAGFSASVGLPNTYQVNSVTLTFNSDDVSPLYKPTSTEPGHSGTVEYQVTDVPEPTSLAILGSVLAGFGWLRRRHRNAV